MNPSLHGRTEAAAIDLTSPPSSPLWDDDDEVQVVAAPEIKIVLDTNKLPVDQDIMVTGTVNATNLPHQRKDCTIHAFGQRKSYSSYCVQCFCYVCDVRASQCLHWTGPAKHCLAFDDSRTMHKLWYTRRLVARDLRKAAAQVVPPAPAQVAQAAAPAARASIPSTTSTGSCHQTAGDGSTTGGCDGLVAPFPRLRVGVGRNSRWGPKRVPRPSQINTLLGDSSNTSVGNSQTHASQHTGGCAGGQVAAGLSPEGLREWCAQMLDPTNCQAPHFPSRPAAAAASTMGTVATNINAPPRPGVGRQALGRRALQPVPPLGDNSNISNSSAAVSQPRQPAAASKNSGTADPTPPAKKSSRPKRQASIKARKKMLNSVSGKMPQED